MLTVIPSIVSCEMISKLKILTSPLSVQHIWTHYSWFHSLYLFRCNEFIHPLPVPPPLVTVTVNWIAVEVDCKGWWNLQLVASLLQLVTKLFTVGDETYIGTHRTATVSFITNCKSYACNCKSDTGNCKFCQNLQLATVTGTAIWLTITRGHWNQTLYAPGGDWKQKFLISYAPPGYTGEGGDWKLFTNPFPVQCE